MTARKMTVRGVEIPASVLDAVDAKIAEHTSRPFTASDVTMWVRMSADVGVIASSQPRVAADRIIQRHRKAGRIIQPKRGQWLWVAKTSALSHGEIGDWKACAYTLAKHMIRSLPTRWDRQGAVLRRSDAIAYMQTHGWLTFTDADLDAATQGEDIRWE